MKRKMKRTTKQFMIVAVICIVIIGGAATFTSVIITKQIRDEYEALLNDAYHDRDMNRRDIYVAADNILSGELITSENIEKRLVYSSQPEDSFISEEDIGKAALIDIPIDTQVIDSMLTGNFVTSELREVEFSVINISSNINSNDVVDVRIFYPNGESYVVLSKKILKEFVPDTATCFLWLNEEELHRMSAAIVDAGLYSGAKLYVTKYIEPSIQDASIVTYTPSLSILSLIENDPNIVERLSLELNKDIRKALENRLAANMETNVSDISWDIESNNQYVTEEIILPNSVSSNLHQEDFLYHAEENSAKDGDMEYGE